MYKGRAAEALIEKKFVTLQANARAASRKGGSNDRHPIEKDCIIYHIGGDGTGVVVGSGRRMRGFAL